jgi:3-oxoacyl-[acyl-carrier protein] reductase
MRKALVTGSSRGIGRAIALELASKGYALAIHYGANQAAGQATASEALERGASQVALIGADLSSPTAAAALVAQAHTELGGLDILVNNAGITRDGLLIRMSDQDWADVIQTNLTAVFATTREAIKFMLRAKWGRIINISSVVGILGTPGQANYVAAKAGLIGFTKTAAKEYATRGITVNAIAPGFIESDMTAKLSEAQQADYLKQIPVGRFGTPEDIAKAAAFLVSEDSSYITGQTLCIDGGMTPH